PARLPPLLGHRHGALSDGPPPLPRRHRARGGRGGLAAPRRMIRATTPCEEQLIGLLAAAGRGPVRDGVFALGLVPGPAEALLRRALSAARQHLEPGTPAAAAVVLSQLVAPARDVLGPEAGNAVAVAARTARIHL